MHNLRPLSVAHLIGEPGSHGEPGIVEFTTEDHRGTQRSESLRGPIEIFTEVTSS
jgi:hypothetical protein